ncbi:MAG: M23 family metallopeptidase [Bacilli bacterium]
MLPAIFICAVLGGHENIDVGDTEIEGVANSLSPPFLNGTKYTIMSEFGNRLDPINNKSDFHSGIDLSAPEGTLIVASDNGVVSKVVTSDNSLGNHVYIKHNLNGEIYFSVYAHMKQGSIIVHAGEQVQAKQPLGIIGMTGRATGIHCHFMIYKGSITTENLVNPKDLVEL